ncbi:MAG: RNA 2',3'-cyclic phosphodiesterase, partial [Gemmatimonadetes bacterium]|nr:RNA 2',3'-cyclic phosphodiesterase [Gemmatimonadota bacterium]
MRPGGAQDPRHPGGGRGEVLARVGVDHRGCRDRGGGRRRGVAARHCSGRLKPLRLFFALWPPEDVRERLWESLAPLRRARPGVRWVPPERYHVTLRFLGDTPTGLLPSLKLAADALGEHRAFRAGFTGPGVFPPRGAPRVFWVGITPGPLPRMRGILDAALTREGIAPERRRFTPHITVGRARSGG